VPEKEVTKLKLYIKCKNLFNMDITSKTDPFARLFTRDDPSKEWRLIGETETIQEELNPNFSTIFDLFYSFEK
jgi:hypothetical protein